MGLLFDRSLSWKHPINFMVDKYHKRINILKALSGTKWGTNKETMVKVKRGLIWSCFDYGSEVYDSACESNKLKIDRIQYQSLRLCTEALRCTSVDAIQVDCGEMPLDLQRNLKQVKTSIKYNSFSDHLTRKCFEECSDLHYLVNMMIILNKYILKPRK